MYANVRSRCNMPESNIMLCINYISFFKNPRVFVSVTEFAKVLGGDGQVYTTAVNTFRLCVGHPFSYNSWQEMTWSLGSGSEHHPVPGQLSRPRLTLFKKLLIRIFFQLDRGIIDKVIRYFKCKTWWFNVYTVKMLSSSSSLTHLHLFTFFKFYFPSKFQL